MIEVGSGIGGASPVSKIAPLFAVAIIPPPAIGVKKPTI
jgi:hypothetical protein